MTDDDDQRRLASHEAAHYAAAYVLLGQTPALSIRRAPGRHDGVTVGLTGTLDFSGHNPGTLLADAAPGLRNRTELLLLFILAGRAAEDVLRPPTSGYEPPDPFEAEVAGEASLPPVEAAALVRAEMLPPDPPDALLVGDDAEAVELARRLVGWERAGAYLLWMRAEARAFCRAYAAEITALAAALLERRIMSGADAASIVRGVAAADTEGSKGATTRGTAE